MRVLHVTESFGGGVETAIADIIDAAPQHDHSLWFAPRSDSDRTGAMDAAVPTIMAAASHRERVAQLVELSRSDVADVVWAHSSFAGAYTRVRRLAVPVIYTPHCYAFCRTDLLDPVRAAFYAVEAALARRSAAVAACGHDEADRARKLSRRTPVTVVPNRVPDLAAGARTGPVTAMGRLCAQKDPAFFAAVADSDRRAGRTTAFRWIGGGDDALAAQLEASGVEVTGWVLRSEAVRLLSDASAYVHTAAWDGSPLTVLEAAAFGVPTVARNIPAVRGEGVQLVGDAPVQVAEIVARLVADDPELSAAAAADTAHLRATHRRDDQVAAIDELLANVIPGPKA